MRTTAARLFALAALAALAGCAAARPEPAEPRQDAAVGPLVPSLQVRTFADSVRFTLRVTNGSAAAVPVTFASGQSADFTVMTDGREVWRWSSDMAFTQAVRRESFAAGETRTFEATWRTPRGTAGEFVARGTLTSSDRRLEQTARFTLP